MHVSYASVVLNSCVFCWAGISSRYTGGVCLPGWTLRQLSFGRLGAVSNFSIFWFITSTAYLLIFANYCSFCICRLAYSLHICSFGGLYLRFHAPLLCCTLHSNGIQNVIHAVVKHGDKLCLCINLTNLIDVWSRPLICNNISHAVTPYTICSQFISTMYMQNFTLLIWLYLWLHLLCCTLHADGIKNVIHTVAMVNIAFL